VPRKPQSRPDRLYALVERQGGYFTAADAKALGYGYPLHHFHVRQGNWIRVAPATFRLKRFPPVAHDDLIRWWLWSRKLGVISHQSAAQVYGIGGTPPGQAHLQAHLIVPPRFRKRMPDGLVLHRAVLQGREVDTREGFPMTTPLRTILDLAEARLDHEQLTAVVTDAVRKGLVDRRALLDVLNATPKRIDPSFNVTIQLAARG